MTGVRTELTLRRVNHHLIQGHVPFGRRRQILRDLRAHIRDASGDVGERQALARLGDPADHAREYVDEADTRRPRVRTGVLWACWTLGALLVLALVRIPTFGTIEVFDAHTGSTTWHIQLWRFAELGGDASSDTLFEATIYSYTFLLLGAAAFVIGARLWRLLSRAST